MANLIWTDGFEGYGDTSISTARMQTILPQFYGNCSITFNPCTIVTGRNGLGYAIRMDRNSTDADYFGLSVSNNRCYTIGFAIYVVTYEATDHNLVEFYDGTTAQLQLRFNSSRQLYFKRGSTTLGTGSTVLSTATWYHIELRVFIDDSSGSAELKINEVSELNLTSVDTKNAASNNYANIVRFYSPGNMYMDDLFVFGNTGTTVDAFIGDHIVETINPTAEGTTNDWTPSTGTDNSVLVDDTSRANDDADYVQSSTAGHRDLYVCSDLANVTGNIKCVTTKTVTRNTDSTSHSIKHTIRESSTNYDSSAFTISSTAYAGQATLNETNPDTGVSWLVSEVNAAEFGIKLES